MAIQFAETGLVGSLQTAINNTDATPVFNVVFKDKNLNTARIPNSSVKIFCVDRGNEFFEIFYGTHATVLGITTITTIARGLPLTYSATPLVAVSGNYKTHYQPAEVSVVDIATYLNIIGNILSGVEAMASILNMGSNKITNVSDCTNAQDAATKNYVDGIAIAGSPKATEIVYGLSKLSTAAVDPLQPIAVGNNDVRVPTALVATSAGVGDAGKTPVFNANGLLNQSIVEGWKDTTATSTEINQVCDGVSANVTASNLGTLTAGSTSEASALHKHGIGVKDIPYSFYSNNTPNEVGTGVVSIDIGTNKSIRIKLNYTIYCIYQNTGSPYNKNFDTEQGIIETDFTNFSISYLHSSGTSSSAYNPTDCIYYLTGAGNVFPRNSKNTLPTTSGPGSMNITGITKNGNNIDIAYSYTVSSNGYCGIELSGTAY